MSTSKKTAPKLRGYIDRNGKLIRNDEGIPFVIIEPERRKVNGNNSTDNNGNQNTTTSKPTKPGIDINFINNHVEGYTASYKKDESSEDETPLVASNRRSTNPGRKSILYCSMVQTEKASIMRFWNTLGKCHLSPEKFKWDSDDGAEKYNPDLGRAYYSKCSLKQNEEWISFENGDFVWRRVLLDNGTTIDDPNKDIMDPHDGFPKMFRIIAMFQAMKSYRGKWLCDDTCNDDGKVEDIQTRGHPFMIVCPVYPIDRMQQLIYGKKKNPNIQYHELALGPDCKNLPGRVFLLPLWFGEPGIEWKKIQVYIAQDGIEASNEAEFLCSKELTKDFHEIMRAKRTKKSKPPQYLRPLTSDILTMSNPMKKYSPKKWEASLNAVQCQFVRHTRRFNTGIPNQYYCASDDSDDFDVESQLLIKNDDEYDLGDSSDEDIDEDDDLPPAMEIKDKTNKMSVWDIFNKQQSQRQEAPEEILPRIVVQGDVDSICETNLIRKQPIAAAVKSHDTYIQKINELIELGMVENGLDYSDKLKSIQNDFLRDVSEHRPISEFLNVQKPSAVDDGQGMRKKSTSERFHEIVNSLRSELGYTNGFRFPQAHVCVSALFGHDVIFVAPTGHGKSLCFAVPALHKRDQITLIIEPLKAIIDDQVQKFNSEQKIKVAALQSCEDVLYNGGQRAEVFLRDIADSLMKASTNINYFYDGPVILFCTAELANSEGVKNELKRIHQYGKLNRIVLDEFDVAAEASDNWREVYKHIIPTLRALVPTVPFTLLSATTCKKELLDLVRGLQDDPQRSKPQLFFHTRPISDSLVFSVERKESDDKVAKRIQFILNSYETMNSGEKPKCICYCLTKSNCEKMNNLFLEMGMKTEKVTADCKDRGAVVQRLKNNKIQIICATKALGRGVDISDIRFVFHTFLPCSLHDYVQETGRAGRDGVPSYCVLFYRPQDKMKTEGVMRLRAFKGEGSGYNVLGGEERKKAVEKLKKVIKYATHADENMCRYAFLVSVVSVSEAVEEDNTDSCLICQEPVLCDLCSMRLGKNPHTIFPLKQENQVLKDDETTRTVQLKTLNINPLLKYFLKRYEEDSRKKSALRITECNKLLLDCIGKVNEDAGQTFTSLEQKLPKSVSSGQFSFSIRSDLFRYLNEIGVLRLIGKDKDKFLLKSDEFFKYHEKIKHDRIKFLLCNVRSLDIPEQDFAMREVETGVAIMPSRTSAFSRPSVSNARAATFSISSATTLDFSPARLNYFSENTSTPQPRMDNLKEGEDSFYNITPPAIINDYSTNDFVTPAPRTNPSNFLDSLSYPKRTADEVKEAYLKCSVPKDITPQQSILVNFSSKLITPSPPITPAIAKRDSDIKAAIARNYQGLDCPRLKMSKELIDIPSFSTLPFLIQHELYRLYNQENPKVSNQIFAQLVKEKLLDISWDWHNDALKSCRFLNKSANTIHHMSTYDHILKIATESNMSPDEGVSSGSLLYFSASFGANGSEQLVLRPPETSADRRIYRKYGSHRFLEVQIYSDVIRKHIQTLMHRRDPLWICGRTYTFLWAKATKAPQSYVLFAESGIGITTEDELTVDDVRYWCLCPQLNPEMTVAKEHKRMKLNFSKTTPACVLPDYCLEVIDDIKGDGENIMTDGCGLISREALNHIWNGYIAYDKKRREYLKKNLTELMSNDDMDDDDFTSEECEFTSFQGRIGGFKGMWVLDDTLEGFKVICRESQLKYLLPMKSMCTEKMNQICNERQISPDTLQYDELYDTVEICSWDKGPETGKLNIRAIQIFEYRGVSIDFFKKRVDEGLEWIDKLKEGGSEALLLNLKSTHEIEARVDKAAGDMFDDDLVFRMAAVKVPRTEPVFADLIDKRVRKEADVTRKKAKYPLRYCYQLRMIPDHTGLLEENEAFVVGLKQMCGKINPITFQNLVTMRSPAYFAGDLLKLKMVNMKEIMKRSLLTGETDCLSFFDNLHTGLILSTKGGRSRADMMSGGDFDGDKAWVCFDPQVTEQICDCPPPITNTPDYELKKSDKESELAFESTIFDRVSFSWNFKNHQSTLGILSNTLDSVLDSCGFDSEEAKIIGREAFLQVDHPYIKRDIPSGIKKKLTELQEPHWRGLKMNVYKSNKALGIIWDYVEQKIESVRNHNNQNYSKKAEANQFIMYHIHKKVDSLKATNDNKGAEYLFNLRKTMKKAARQHNLDVHNYLKENAAKKDDEFDRIYWNWLKGRHEYWRNTLLGKMFDEELTLAAAVLYEQVWELSIENSYGDDEKVYKFAWHVAHDVLTRIIADGMARESGRGLPVCINRDIEKNIFDRFKKK